MFYAIGSLTCSSIIRKLGRRSSTVVVLMADLLIISYAYAPTVWLSVALMSVAGWFDCLAASASTSLTLERMPELRGTMMSMSYAFVGVGSAAGAAIGGTAPVLYSYQELGFISGGTGIVTAVAFRFLTSDPTERAL